MTGAAVWGGLAPSIAFALGASPDASGSDLSVGWSHTIRTASPSQLRTRRCPGGLLEFVGLAGDAGSTYGSGCNAGVPYDSLAGMIVGVREIGQCTDGALRVGAGGFASARQINGRFLFPGLGAATGLQRLRRATNTGRI